MRTCISDRLFLRRGSPHDIAIVVIPPYLDWHHFETICLKIRCINESTQSGKKWDRFETKRFLVVLRKRNGSLLSYVRVKPPISRSFAAANPVTADNSVTAASSTRRSRQLFPSCTNRTVYLSDRGSCPRPRRTRLADVKNIRTGEGGRGNGASC